MQGFAFLNLDVRHHPDLEVIAQRLNGISLKDVELNVQTDQVRFFISPFFSSKSFAKNSFGWTSSFERGHR